MSDPWKRVEIGLVLQGGGALGAYEWGAITALFDLMDEAQARGLQVTLKAVTGVSIGAINGACVVGAKDRSDARRRLEALWRDLALETPLSWFRTRWNFSVPGLPDLSFPRDLALLGLPGFYAPRTDVWNFANWTSLYDTAPLLDTLRDHVDFAALNASETTFVVTAVDVREGTLRRFRNRRPTAAEKSRAIDRRPDEEEDEVVVFEPRHILASGSLAPQFPWTPIEDGIYWDGGLVDNTPLGDAAGAFSRDADVYRLLVVMNLYPLRAREPANLPGVADRVHELSLGNRLRQDRKAARRINELVRIIEDLAVAAGPAAVSGGLRHRVEAATERYKIMKIVDIDLQNVPAPGRSGEQDSVDGEAGLRDFSPSTIAFRHGMGRQRAFAALRPVFQKHAWVQPQAVVAALRRGTPETRQGAPPLSPGGPSDEFDTAAAANETPAAPGIPSRHDSP